MALNRNSGGHRFIDPLFCARCGMTRKDYDDKGKPRCTGKPRQNKKSVMEAEP
jgi:hypothetical protein